MTTHRYLNHFSSDIYGLAGYKSVPIIIRSYIANIKASLLFLCLIFYGFKNTNTTDTEFIINFEVRHGFMKCFKKPVDIIDQ